MDKITRRILLTFGVLMLAALAVLHAADPPQSATKRKATSDDQADKSAPRPNVVIIGASSLTSPVGLAELVGAMLESDGIQMNFEGRFPELDAVSEMLNETLRWTLEPLGSVSPSRTPLASHT